MSWYLKSKALMNQGHVFFYSVWDLDYLLVVGQLIYCKLLVSSQPMELSHTCFEYTLFIILELIIKITSPSEYFI